MSVGYGHTLGIDGRGVATVSLDRPEVRNAFDDRLVAALAGLFGDLARKGGPSVVVVRGEGPGFCAGADVNWMGRMARLSAEENLEDARGLSAMLAAVDAFPRPVLARIHGFCLGGGAGLAAVCDHAAASDDAVFGFTEARLGLVPAVVGPWVVARIGEARARSLFPSGERFGADAALAMGLVHETSPPDRLDDAVERKVRALLRAGPAAREEAKRLVRRIRRGGPGLAEDVCATTARLRASPEGQEGMASLLEKRRPSWDPGA